MANFCPHCGGSTRPGATFCGVCGRPLQPSATPTPTPAPAPAGSPILVARWPGGQLTEYPLTKFPVHVGRNPTNEVVLNFPTVSGRHLRLEQTPAGIQVSDLNSTNGTSLNGQKLPAQQPHPWQIGDILRVGDAQGNSLSLNLKGNQALGRATFRTRRLSGRDLGQGQKIIIGRDPACQLRLDHPSVSRQHAEISNQQGHILIRDLQSGNGTYVEGQRIAGNVRLGAGAVIQIGPFKLLIDGQTLRPAQQVGHRLDAVQLGMQVKGGRMILQQIDLTVQAGEFVALVGGSGAGKSTLMQAMNGYQQATHGQMLIDGDNLYSHLEVYRPGMGYVPQDDIIHRELTVYRALWYAARLRLPDANRREVSKRIDAVLQVVDMAAHSKKEVRVLSGGQRKRVSIAVELLAEPDLLFLDEPTSGLDPGLEKKMMSDLNRVADQGKTVVLITHATANIEQCDHVAFLADGQLSYYGPPQEAITFFGVRDFADIYLKLAERIDPGRVNQLPPPLQAHYHKLNGQNQKDGELPAGVLWAEEYRQSPLHHKYIASHQSHIAAGRHPAGAAKRPQSRDSIIRQTAVLIGRQLELIRRDIFTLFVLLFMMPILGFLFMAVSGHCDWAGWESRASEQCTTDRNTIINDLTRLLQENNTDKEDYTPAPTATRLITILGLALTQAGTFGAIFEIVKERAIFKREKAVNLRVTAYVLAKVIVLSLFAIWQIGTVLLILSLKVDLSLDPVNDFLLFGTVELFITLVLAVTASLMLGLFISAIVPNQNMVVYILLVQLFTQIILSGSLFPLPDNPASKLVISYWTMNAMGETVAIAELNQLSQVCTRPEGSDTIQCIESKLDDDDLTLKSHNAPSNLLLDWFALAIQIAIWGGLTLLIQTRRKIE